MERTAASFQCPWCARDFTVELNRVRSNYPNRCPSCGAGYMISSDEAIRVHRLLERIEFANRTPGPVGPAGERPGPGPYGPGVRLLAPRS